MSARRWFLIRLVLQLVIALGFAAEAAATVGHGPFLVGAYIAAALLILALAGTIVAPTRRLP
jgi:hypothetical protein